MAPNLGAPDNLVNNTQGLILNALLKKKHEERQETYQQQQRSGTPVAGKQTHSPTPLAFTPTSVMRKMTADKGPEGANRYLIK